MNTKNKEGGWWKPLWWFFLILLGFWILWYLTGGPQRAAVNQGLFMNPSQPIDNGGTYDLSH